MSGKDAVFRKALTVTFLAPVLAALFLGALAASVALPNGPIEKHALEREEVLLARRADNGRVIDADTECIGLSVSMPELADTPDDAVKRAVLAQSFYGCAPLMSWLERGETGAVRYYFRYWHGYLTLLRPLLSIMPYNDVRGFIFVLSILTFGWLAWRIGGDFGAPVALAFALPFLVLNAMGYWVVVTKAVTWLLAVGAGLFLSRRNSGDPPLIAFFLLGALTAFFDFFTAPIFIVSFATMIWMLYELRRDAAADIWMKLFSIGCFWAAGYAGLWGLKLAIAAFMFGDSVWRDAAGAALFRLRGASGYVDGYWPGAAILANLKALKSIWLAAAVIVFMIAPFVRAKGRREAAMLGRQGRPALAVALAPVLWLEIVSNHSQIHAAFTQLNLAPVFILSGLVLVARTDVLRPAQPRQVEAPCRSPQLLEGEGDR